MFTPQEVSEKVFPKASFGGGGYNMASVDEFLDALTEEPEARELVEETVQSAERARLLRTCMAELHEDYREALFLVYFEGLSHAETAAVMGRREKQVADLIYRGKIALRKRLEQEGITDAYNG